MVTASKKPKAAPKKEVKPKATAKKATASKPKAAPKKVAAAKKAAPAPKKATPAPRKAVKPKATEVKAKTAKKTSAPAKKAVEARKVGEMVYNDELFESLAETVLLAEAEMEGLLPEVKGQLYDYDIYLVSFLDDEEIGSIAEYLAGNARGAVSADALKPRLLAIRDNARVFVAIASEFNSVRAFIDRMVKADDRAGLNKKFNGNLKEVHPDTFESFVLLF